MNGRMDRQTVGQTDKQMDRWTGRQIDGRIDGRTEGQMDRQRDGHTDNPVSYTHLRAHETGRNLVCRLLLEKKNDGAILGRSL